MKLFRVIRYPAAALLFIAAFLLSGELYRQSLGYMPVDYWECATVFPEDTDPAFLFQRVEEAAEAEGEAVIFSFSTYSEDGRDLLTLYGTAGMSDILLEDYGLREGTYPSLFFGTLTLRFRPLTDIDDGTILRRCTFSGSEAAVRRLHTRLQEAGFSYLIGQKAESDRSFVIGCWVLILSLLLLLKMYELALAKKEVLLRAINGEGLERQIGGAVLWDLTVFVGCFAVVAALLSRVTCVTGYIRPILFCFGGFLAVNSALHLWLFFTDYKRDIATDHAAWRALQFSYVYKIITAVFCMLTMAGSVTLLWNNRDILIQQRFFQEHGDYSFVILSDYSLERHEDLQAAFYAPLYEQGRVLMLNDRGEMPDSSAHWMIASPSAGNYLAQRIPSLAEEILAAKDMPLLLIPKGYEDRALALAQEWQWESAVPLTYTDRAQVMGISASGERNLVNSAILRDPVILLEPGGRWASTFGNTVMVHVSDEEWRAFVEKETPLTCVRVNAYENFRERSRVQIRGISLSCAALVLFLLLEGFIVRTILQCEFRVRAMEITLKRLHGYSVLRRYSTPLLTAGCSGAAGLGVAMLLCFQFEVPLGAVLALGTILTLTEWGLMIAAVLRMERRRLSKVLKGGIR